MTIHHSALRATRVPDPRKKYLLQKAGSASIRRHRGGTTTTLATYSNLNESTGYVQKQLDLSAYKGKSVTVRFLGVEDSSLSTYFFLDDASVAAS